MLVQTGFFQVLNRSEQEFTVAMIYGIGNRPGCCQAHHGASVSGGN
jgi:hypothetical protein